MKAVALREFYDLKERKIRRKGETFDATKERIAELANSRFGELAKQARKGTK